VGSAVSVCVFGGVKVEFVGSTLVVAAVGCSSRDVCVGSLIVVGGSAVGLVVVVGGMSLLFEVASGVRLTGETAPGFWRVCERSLRRATAAISADSVVSVSGELRLMVVDDDDDDVVTVNEDEDDDDGVPDVLLFACAAEVLRGDEVADLDSSFIFCV
jgi:hypothetical protein